MGYTQGELLKNIDWFTTSKMKSLIVIVLYFAHYSIITNGYRGALLINSNNFRWPRTTAWSNASS